MNRKLLIGAGATTLAIGGLYFLKPHTTQTPTTNTSSQTATDNAQQVAPGLYENKITNISTIPGLEIIKTEVENIIGPDGKAQDDHLQVTVKNTSATTLTSFEAYYTITDTKTQQKEGYFQKLDGFSVDSGKTAIISFDGASGAGHFPVNTSSLFYKSQNKLQFAVEISAAGVAPQNSTVTKDAGGAETQD